MKNKEPLKIFILDDDKWYGTMLEYYLSLNPEFCVKRFDNAEDFIYALKEGPDVVTIDYVMPQSNGLQVLKQVKYHTPETEVIVVSAQEDVGLAVNLKRNGAYEYVIKNEECCDNIQRSLKYLYNSWQKNIENDFFEDPLNT